MIAIMGDYASYMYQFRHVKQFKSENKCNLVHGSGTLFMLDVIHGCDQVPWSYMLTFSALHM